MYKLPENLRNKYEFVTLASQRAEQLQMGSLARVEAPGRKFTVVAQQEIAEDRIELVDPDAEPEEAEATEE